MSRISGLICLGIVCLPPGGLVAQTDSVRAVVEGRVISSSGSPLSDTEIIWQTDRRSVLSRADGSFNLVVPVRAPTVILVRRPGYSAQVLRVDLSRGMWRGTIVLEPGSFRLPEVTVEVRYAKPAEYAGTSKYDGFFQRQKLGIGSFVTRDQIEKMNAFHTLETLRGIPGIKVDVGNPGDPRTADIVMARCQEGASRLLGRVVVAIDGMVLLGNRGGEGTQHGGGSYTLAEMLGRIAAPDIELVEVYRGTAQIPAEFYQPNACGAVAIWTRYGRDPAPDPTRKPEG